MPCVPSRFSAAVLAGTICLIPWMALFGQTPTTNGSALMNGTVAAEEGANKPVGETPEAKQPAEKSRSELLAAQRFELIRRRVAAAEIRADEADFPTRFAEKPIFRYSDLARGHVAAAVWKLGDVGRPKAILSTGRSSSSRSAQTRK